MKGSGGSFWDVFAAGAMVLTLARYHAWTHDSEQARLLRKRVEVLDRTLENRKMD